MRDTIRREGARRQPADPAGPPERPTRVDVVLIAASTGGPQAIHTLLKLLPEPLAVPMLVVQHHPPGLLTSLAERLDAASPTRVRLARHGEQPAPGTAHLAAGDRHLEVGRRHDGRVTLRLRSSAPVRSHRPAADVLLRSAAATYGAGALALVLSGMSGDALQGCVEITRAGGRVLVQDEASSVAWGMPGSIAGAGLAHGILPLDELPAALTTLVGPPPGGRDGTP